MSLLCDGTVRALGAANELDRHSGKSSQNDGTLQVSNVLDRCISSSTSLFGSHTSALHNAVVPSVHDSFLFSLVCIFHLTPCPLLPCSGGH